MDRFWDIESYDNLFCVSFLDDNDHLDMFHLCADEDVADVERACRDSGYEYTRYDLRTDGEKLKEYMANPIPSDGKPTLLKARGRHDPCVLPRAVPIVEAMAAMTVLDYYLLNKTVRL